MGISSINVLVEKQRDYHNCLIALCDNKTRTSPNFFFTACVTDAAGWKDKKKEIYPERDGRGVARGDRLTHWRGNYYCEWLATGLQ